MFWFFIIPIKLFFYSDRLTVLSNEICYGIIILSYIIVGGKDENKG